VLFLIRLGCIVSSLIDPVLECAAASCVRAADFTMGNV
jgi:hypothetical protein